MKILLLLSFFSFLFANTAFSQIEVSGNVYAFKDLTLNNIEVSSKKTKQTVKTDEHGYFKIQCGNNDRLTFTGEGFQKVVQKVKDNARLRVKMIFINNDKNKTAAIENEHVTENKLNESIDQFHEYNFIYFNYSNIFELLKKMYLRDIIIRYENGKGQVFVKRKGSNEFHRLRTLYIVNGKREEDITYIQTRDIEYIKVHRDGESKYSTSGFFGAVEIKTFKK